MRLLLFSTTTGYQLRAFDAAAAAMGVDLQLATDRCDHLDDPWRDRALPVRFHERERAVEDVLGLAAARPFDGVLAVGDRPAALAARAAEALGLPFHTPEGAEISRSKLGTRRRLREAGLPVPDFGVLDSPAALDAWAGRGPIVVKPAALSGSRGVIRADTPDQVREAFARVRRLLDAPEIVARRDPEAAIVIAETFIPGREYALEGVMTAGRLTTLALFDKPDPLYGPFFEETLYITPSRAPSHVQRAILRTVGEAAAALGLRHGPIHAECRVNQAGVYVLEVAARPIGGLCSRCLRFADRHGEVVSLEALLVGHALGQPVGRLAREAAASGVMMIPIPGPGVYRGAGGVERARAVEGVDDVVMTAKVDQTLLPLPEGSTYLGFIFARGATPVDVERALREAHACLEIRLDRAVPVVS